MKFQILHESTGRMRIRLLQPRMTPAQADQLEMQLQDMSDVTHAVVHERTRCAIIYYQGSREQIMISLARLSCEAQDVLIPTHSSRSLNRTYGEKLVGIVAFHFVRSLFFPSFLRKICTVIHSVPYIFRGLRCLWKRQLHVELLDGLSVSISMAHGNFHTASSVMFLLDLGELLEEWTHKKSVEDLAASMSLHVDRIWLQTDRGEVLTSIDQIQAGDRVSVRTGGMIPLDSVVREGEAMVNQASLTGESVPVAKRPGSLIYAGTVVEEGAFIFEVTQQSGESRYDKIVSMIEQSEKLKSETEDRALRLADKLVPCTLLGSGVTWLLTGSVNRALSVLMVDFSCALKLAMPLAVLSAMREAVRYRIVVKGGKYLEAIAKSNTIIFDKTGTLTRACPVVAQVIPFSGRDENEMLRLAACLEEHFPHSMANAVVRAAQERELLHEEMHSQVKYLVAHGIASTVNGEKVIIGSAHFVFDDENCVIPDEEQERFHTLSLAFSHLYLAISGVLAAVICISDPLRPEAADVIEGLKELGISQTVMLTGDSERTAAAVAAQIGLDEYHAEVLPEDKAHFVDAIQKQGKKVIMLGDGINDAPALSAADVGIAISDSAAIAREISDVTILADDLHALIGLRKIAQALECRIHANYRFVIGFNGALMLSGIAGILSPASSAILHNLSTLGISLRSMTKLLGP